MEDNIYDPKENGAKVILACSGAADVGELTDLVARKLHKQNIGAMKCLALVGSGVSELNGYIKDKRALMIDGCSLDCGKKILVGRGLTNFTHLRLSDLGYAKGKSTPEQHKIDAVFEVASELI